MLGTICLGRIPKHNFAIMFWITAHGVIAVSLKHLAHRNPNVQLYTLSLVDSLSQNCGIVVNREIASRASTPGLQKIVTDRVS